MTLALFNTIEDIELLIDCDNKPWFKRAHVGAFLRLEDIRTSIRNLEGDEFCTREQLRAKHNTPDNFKRQDHDVFLSVYGVMHVIINSRKERGKELKEFIFKEIIPRGLNEKIKQLQEDHQLAITDRDNKIQAIQYENVGLQGEIREKDHQIAQCENRIQDLIANRHVPRRGVIDTVLSLIDKQCENEPHKFYMIRCQYKNLNNHKKWLRNRYPNMIEKGESDDPNAVHRWCSFKKDFFSIENYYKKHFSMTEEQEELFETVFELQI